jgi:O-antigen/teichoic acid export membrane protein
MILALYRNDAQIGFYSAALRMVDLWSVIPETYMRSVFPVLSHAYIIDRVRCQVILERSIKYLLAVSLPLMCGIFVAARPLVHLLYGSGFEPSVSVLRVMVFCIPVSYLFELLWRVLAARDEQHLMLRAQVIMACVRLTGGYLLIGWLASFGAALSAATALTGHILLLAWYARQDGTQLHMWRLAWRPSVAALVTGAVAATFINRMDLWLVALAAGVFYIVIALSLKALSPDDFALFRRMRHMQTAV